MKKNDKTAGAVVANADGEIFELEGYAAVAMAGNTRTVLASEDVVAMPHGGEPMLLPDRRPVAYNLAESRLEVLDENPYDPGQPLFPVAVFNSPGYVVAGLCAYEENEGAGWLPLFSYAAAGWFRNRLVTPAICVDTEKRQDLRLMDIKKVQAGVTRMRRKMPGNRLRAHLEKCALVYGCPAGKNFFLRRFEAPLPTSKSCNAACLGCISLQSGDDIPCSQNRISFVPAPEEIAEVALAHIGQVRNAVVSFGQGCEGDPLFAASAIEPAIRMIRAETSEGTINMNTNASLPDVLERLFDAGLDSVRVSLNSVRKNCYDAYYRPKGYRFEDVVKSIVIAGKKNRFVSLNYLNQPGFTDSPEEIEAFLAFLENYPVQMIQWRNLNFDPLRYYDIMSKACPLGEPAGMRSLLEMVRRRFPDVMSGYFNPPKEKWGSQGGARAEEGFGIGHPRF